MKEESYINQIEKGDKFWQQDVIKDRNKELILLLFDLAGIAKDEIKELIERAIVAKEKRENWKLNSFYENILKYCLSGLYSKRLTIEMPELIVSTAWKVWKLKPQKEHKSQFYRSYSSLDKEEYWGIEMQRDILPSGIYKTPIYNLLQFHHPRIGINFILEFINYSVDFFVKSDFKYKGDIVELEIELNDGSNIKQWGSRKLWAAYRGSSGTNYLLESLLMSLEKYLLDLAQYKTEKTKKNLQLLFNYLLKNSKSVAITSVLTSVAIAYPEEVEEEMLPLLSVKDFYHWDLMRSTDEISSLAPIDYEIPFAQEERIKSNRLPHRRKYTRGLRDFIVDYQFNVGRLNEKIHKIFDKLQEKAGTNDIFWKKALNEMDIRHYKVADVAEFNDSNKEDVESLNYSGLLLNAHKKKEKISFQSWEECFALASFHLLFDHIVNAEDKNELTALMIYMLSAPLAEHEIYEITEYVRTVFFKTHPEIGKKVWIGLIKYAQFRKATQKNKLEEQKIIQNFCINDDLALNIENIDLEKYEGYTISVALLITPNYLNNNLFHDFIKRVVFLITEDLKLEQNYNYSINNKLRQLPFQILFNIRSYLGELLLYADKELSKSVIDLLLNPIYESVFVRELLKNNLPLCRLNNYVP